MLRRLACPARVGPDRRIDDENADVRIREIPLFKATSREIYDAHAVGLADRAQRALPYADPPRMQDESELRAGGVQRSVLLIDR